MTAYELRTWREDAIAIIAANSDGTHVWAAGRIVALLDEVERLGAGISRLADVYEIAPTATDISDELRRLLP